MEKQNLEVKASGLRINVVDDQKRQSARATAAYTQASLCVRKRDRTQAFSQDSEKRTSNFGDETTLR